VIIVCPTVPHTGTHFIRDLLQHAPRAPGIERILVAHPYPGNRDGLRKLVTDGNPVVLPRRDPDAVRGSWIKYGKDLADYAGASIDEWFRIQTEVIAGGAAFFLDLDQPGRRTWQLNIINMALGLDLVTDWQPVRQPGA
jgi:hypothetical protein